MFGICRQGFGLIEILVALAILALVGTLVVPAIWRTDPVKARRDIRAHLNELTGFAQQQAIISGHNHAVEFDIKQRIVKIMRVADKTTSDGKPTFEPIKSIAIKPDMVWPKNLEIKQFFLEGIDEMSRLLTGTTTRVWFFVLPDGMTQTVTLNIVDTKDGIRGKGKSVSWVLNPFSAQFKEYDAFQK